MLKELTKVKIEVAETSGVKIVTVIKKDNQMKINSSTNSSKSKTSSDEEISKLEEAFGKLQRITNKRVNPTSFTKKLVYKANTSKYAI